MVIHDLKHPTESLLDSLYRLKVKLDVTLVKLRTADDKIN